MSCNRAEKHERTWPMCGAEKVLAAKKIAAILAESAATVSDMLDVFKMVESELTGYPRFPPRFTHSIHPLEFPDKMRDDDGVWDK